MIGGRQLQPDQEFTYDVSAEEMAEGGPFKRNILVGRFSSTSKTDYCDGSEENDD